jgi:ribonuclease T
LLNKSKKPNFANRFRSLLPVVIDIETSGLNPSTDALLELAAVMLRMDENGQIVRDCTFGYTIEPFPGARLDPASLEITGIDPFQPFRDAIPEQQALRRLFNEVRQRLDVSGCQRAVLVGHNAWFDLSFMQNAIKRASISSSPFHSFTTFDTATLSAVALGETVLARAVKRAGFEFDVSKAHSAVYDAERTADLFCYIVNKMSSLL